MAQAFVSFIQKGIPIQWIVWHSNKQSLSRSSILSALQYEISRLTQTSFAEGKGDAARCFDNIVPCMTSAISQLEEIPKTIFVVHVKILEEEKYHLKLMFNITDEFY